MGKKRAFGTEAVPWSALATQRRESVWGEESADEGESSRPLGRLVSEPQRKVWASRGLRLHVPRALSSISSIYELGRKVEKTSGEQK